MDAPQLDWASAEVSKSTLTVKISGDLPEDWNTTFARTLALLASAGDWGKVTLKKRAVKVKDVPEGSEDRVRFALDGAVQEANAHHVEDDDEADDADGSDDEGDDGDDRDDRDQRMTDRFRGASES